MRNLALLAMIASISALDCKSPSDSHSTATVSLQEVPGAVPAGTVEIRGLSAGEVDPTAWTRGTLNWVPDVRVPLLAPQTSGPFQNIYAAWPLEQTGGWRMFYGGWDGSLTQNDRVYSVTTVDFLSFDNRQLVIDHGVFEHVNNVNVQQLADGSMHMICTVYPDASGLNKPAYFSSPDGAIWNGSAQPYAAQLGDIVSINGYALFASGDFNGANVLLRDGNSWSLYFVNWNDAGANWQVYRATSDTPPAFKSGSVALSNGGLVNDVKKFDLTPKPMYLMGLHLNAPSVWFSMSEDGATFGPTQLLFDHQGAADQYIVSLAFVTSGAKVLGVVYGASAVASLDQNRIYARWLQRQAVITDGSGAAVPLQGGYGPDRQWFTVSSTGALQGTIKVYGDSGNLLGSGSISVEPGKAYQLNIH